MLLKLFSECSYILFVFLHSQDSAVTFLDMPVFKEFSKTNINNKMELF